MPSYIDIVVNPDAVYLEIVNRSLVYVDIQHGSNVTVGSVNGKTGNVVLTYSDVNAAPLNSPGLTGVPTAPTASLGTNTTQIATTAFVIANAPSTTLTSTYIGYGDINNEVTGSSGLTYDSEKLSVRRTDVGGSIYAANNSFNMGGDGPIMAWDGAGSGATLSLGYSSTATFNIRPHSGQLLFEGAGASNGSFSMRGVAYVTQGLSIGTGFGNFSNMLEVNGDTKMTGKLNLSGLPTSPSGLSTGDVWNDSGVLKIV